MHRATVFFYTVIKVKNKPNILKAISGEFLS